MKDGSDAVADWPLLNALLNTASGASWVSIHNGGGVGIGYSQHAGQVTVADGTDEMARRIERVLTNDPGMGVMRHVDAGYDEAKQLCRQGRREDSDGRKVRVRGKPWQGRRAQKQRAQEPAVLLHRISQLVTMSGRAGSRGAGGRCARSA